MEKITKLCNMLSTIADTGRLNWRNVILTQSEYDELWDIGKDIITKGKATTISLKCKNILVKLGFNATSQGIGWEITR